jgi:hypothetical protein
MIVSRLSRRPAFSTNKRRSVKAFGRSAISRPAPRAKPNARDRGQNGRTCIPSPSLLRSLVSLHDNAVPKAGFNGSFVYFSPSLQASSARPCLDAFSRYTPRFVASPVNTGG